MTFGISLGNYASSGGAAAFTPNAVRLAVGGGLERGAKLTGAADSTKGILSFWFKFDQGRDGVKLALTGGLPTNYFNVFRDTDNKWYIVGLSGGSEVLRISTSNTYTNNGGWHILQASWDLSANTSTLYIDGVSDQVVTTRSNANISYNTSATDFFISEVGGASTSYGESLSEFYFAENQFLDFSNATNRAKFVSGGLPVSLGATGSTPTGTAPIVYLKSNASSYATNSGTGGNFTAATSFTNVTPP